MDFFRAIASRNRYRIVRALLKREDEDGDGASMYVDGIAEATGLREDVVKWELGVLVAGGAVEEFRWESVDTEYVTGKPPKTTRDVASEPSYRLNKTMFTAASTILAKFGMSIGERRNLKGRRR